MVLADELTDVQIKAFRLLANRSVTWAGWDDALLALELEDLKLAEFDLVLTGFDATEIDALLVDDHPAENESQGGQDEADDVPEVPANPVSRSGDVWALGTHRLICGDAADAAVVSTLMAGEQVNLLVTSPPYANQRAYTTGGIGDWDRLMQGVFAAAMTVMAAAAQILVNLPTAQSNPEGLARVLRKILSVGDVPRLQTLQQDVGGLGDEEVQTACHGRIASVPDRTSRANPAVVTGDLGKALGGAGGKPSSGMFRGREGKFSVDLKREFCLDSIQNQVRHASISQAIELMARPRRFERPTPAFGGQYSIQLSYGRVQDRELNRFARGSPPRNRWWWPLVLPQACPETVRIAAGRCMQQSPSGGCPASCPFQAASPTQIIRANILRAAKISVLHQACVELKRGFERRSIEA